MRDIQFSELDMGALTIDIASVSDGDYFDDVQIIRDCIENPIRAHSQPVLLGPAKFSAAAWPGLGFEIKYGFCNSVKRSDW